MERLKASLYEVLGVPRDAKVQDITRAYGRYRSQMKSEAAAPDPRRDALMREAYEVLSDPQKREAYDASLRRGFVTRIPARKRQPVALGVALLLTVALLVGGWFLMRREPGPPARGPDELQAQVALALGRVESVDMNGSTRVGGVTIAVDEGIVVTPCAGIAPGAQLRIVSTPRAHPARVAQSDARGRCRLAVTGGAGFPIRSTNVIPSVGERVFVALVGPAGEAMLRPTTVSAIEAAQPDRIVKVAQVASSAVVAGTPLLDADGRLFAVAWTDGQARFSVVSGGWLEEKKEAPVVKSPSDVPEASDTEGAERGKIGPERREKLEKAFRPPPTVPDDL